MKPIEFYGTVAKAQTMVDGGLRVWLDLPETAIMQFAELVACKQHGQVLDFVVTAHPEKQGKTGGQRRNVEIGTKRKPKWATEKEPRDDGDPREEGIADA